jgi:hypothetical protein
VNQPDPRAGRDRTLRRLRVTTAVGGIGAVAVAGGLAGWLGQPGQVYGTSPPASTDSGTSSSTGSGDGLGTPTEAPTSAESGSAGDQPPVVTGSS